MIPLLEASRDLLPKEFASVNWHGIWDRPLEDGTAFQWSMVGAITNALIEHGWKYEVPLLGFSNGNELMTLRNEIPLSHLAQAGHSATTTEIVPLADRFMQSLVPKLTFHKDGRYFSLFIEGCPYHMIATGQRYDVRPDILLLPGKLQEINIQGQILNYKYSYSTELMLEGVIRIGSSRLLPVIQRAPSSDIPLSVIGVVECSVNKSARVASTQLESYKAVFDFAEEEGTVLVTGNEITADCGPMITVNLSTKDLTELKNSLARAGDYIRIHLLEPSSD